MEQLKSRLKLAKEEALAKHAKDDDAKRMARKRKRHDYYVRKKQTAPVQSSKQEQVEKRCYDQQQTNQLASDMDIPIKNKRIRKKCVKTVNVNQNIKPPENPAKQDNSKFTSTRGHHVAVDVSVQVNTQFETPTNSASASVTATPRNVKQTKEKNTRKKKRGGCKNGLSTKKNVPQTTNVGRREQWKEYSRKYRDKIKSDPALSLKQQEKDHERYISRRKSMKIKLISQMTKREQRSMRRRWRINTQNARIRRTDNIEGSPTATNQCVFQNVESSSITEHSYCLERNTSQKTSGRKKVRRDRTSAYLKLAKLQTELTNAKRRADRYKKRLQRIKGGVTNASPSPAKQVRQLLRGRIVPGDIHRRLLYSACLDKQLKRNSTKSRTHKEKQLFVKSVSGCIMKKYRMLAAAKAGHNLSWWLSKHDIMASNIRHRRKGAVSAEQAKHVVSFLSEDTNSRMCAGKRECVTRLGEKHQKRFLNDSLLNLHNKYIEQYNVNMSYVTFWRLCPFWVVEPKVKDRETCLCVKHDNMALLVSKLKVLGVIEHKSPQELCTSVVCSTTSKACMYGECNSCRQNVIPHSVTDLDKKSFYFRWKTTNEKRNRAKDGEPIVVKITAKQKVEATYYEMFQTLETELPTFKQHQYRVDHQQTALSKMKERLRSREMLMVIDFSENYMCKYSSEAQSVHFGASRQQITLHTGVFYYRPIDDTTGFDAENLECKSFCTISSSMRHDPSAIWAHLKPIFTLIQETCPNVDTLHIWSDGPTTQYRNRRNLGIFSKLNTFGNFRYASWNFSESGHGKGAADGIGGSLKRTADKLVAHGEDITNAEILMSALQRAELTTQLYMVQSDDISTIDAQYDTSGVKTIKGTMLLHQVTWTSDKPEFLHLRSLSCLSCPLDSICHHYNEGTVCLAVTFQKHPPSTGDPKSAMPASQTDTETVLAASFIPATSQTNGEIETASASSAVDPVLATSSTCSQTLPHAVSGDSFVPTTNQTTGRTMDEIETTGASSAVPIPSTIVHANNIADLTSDSTDLEHVQLNDYVAIVYDDQWFPGIVEGLSDGKVKIRVMNRSGQYFLWPSKPYLDEIPLSEILCRISGKPIAVSKSRFRFEASHCVDSILDNLGED